ncbi:hypothetical protein LIER_31690 [Lithospermum erythrorhizon]|uniref:Uncharacterized protein n=1 Tax=Lithospermum erythrorhizon TaxID=34254 RepID=A0AAV3RSR3_LITER
MWISIVGFYSVCLLAGMTPTAEFLLNSFSQHTQKDDFFYFTVRTDMKGFCEAFSSKEDKPAMPLPLYTDCRVLKAAGLFPITDTDPGALEALRVSFIVPDRPPLPSPAVPNRSPLRPLVPEPVVVSISSEEDEAMSPLLKRPRPSFMEAVAQNPQEADSEPQGPGADAPPGLERNSSPSPPSSPRNQCQGQPSPAYPASVAAQGNASEQHFATIVLEPEDQGGVGLTTPHTPSSAPFPVPKSCLKGPSISPPGSSLPPRKRMGSSLASSRPSQLPRRSEEEAASSFSSRVGQLEGELKASKDEKAREYPPHRGHGYSLEVVQAERDFIVKEQDILHVGRDEMLQTHDLLLDQLAESQRQAQVMEATLEGTRTTNGLEELVQISDMGRDLLFRHFSRAL